MGIKKCQSSSFSVSLPLFRAHWFQCPLHQKALPAQPYDHLMLSNPAPLSVPLPGPTFSASLHELAFLLAVNWCTGGQHQTRSPGGPSPCTPLHEPWTCQWYGQRLWHTDCNIMPRQAPWTLNSSIPAAQELTAVLGMDL